MVELILFTWFRLQPSPSVSLNVTNNTQIYLAIKELRIMKRNKSPISLLRGKTEINSLCILPELSLSVHIYVHTKWNAGRAFL